MQSITPVQLQARLQSGAQPPVLLDVREDWEFQICHIDGSHNVPMSQVPQSLSVLAREAETVVICHHGLRSLEIMSMLEGAGFDKVFNLEGGIDAWAREVNPDMPQY